MKKHIKSIAGVTLLEIMLVLAIASMVIVMSIRYYQNATNSENTNIVLEEVQNITAASDNLAQGLGSYSGVNATNVASVAGASNMKTPYGSAITIGTGGASTYTVTIPSLPPAVCAALASKLAANSKYTAPVCTASTGTVTYTYNSQS
jgi:type II secretory pathway pseudopilin PulG